MHRRLAAAAAATHPCHAPRPAPRRPSPLPATVQLENPAARGHLLGGGEYGAAVAAAGGLADLAVAVDELGSALVPAACCGAFAFRPTAGVLPLEGGAASAPTLGAPCLLAADPAVLLRAGRGLRVPGAGGGAAAGVANYLVAEDLFGVCGGEVERAAPAVVAAVRRWAGPDQAQGLSLCEWLFHRIPSLAAFMPPPPAADAAAAAAAPDGGAAGQRTEAVLEALAAAAVAVLDWEWARSAHGAWALANPAQLSAAAGAAAAGAAAGASEARYRQGIAVAEELSAGMRAALQQGYIFVLPTAPGPAPRRGGGAEGAAAAAAFHRRCLQFAALASLAGVPQVAMPVPSARGPPLSVSLVTLQRNDMALLQAAAKLGPLLAEEAAALDAPPEAARSRPAAASAPAGPGAEAATALAAAEAAKEAGNAAFKAKKYDDAVRRYSEAIRLSPRSHVFYSNRAMAHLKLGSYGAAEADCDAALELEPGAVKALLRRGSARLARGDLRAARGDFERALQLEPRNRQAADELGRLRGVVGEDDGGSGLGGDYSSENIQ
jgi:tetratricopeptide (TPR) repeat protein